MSPDTGPCSRSTSPGERVPDSGPESLELLPDWRTALAAVAGLAYPFLVYWVLAGQHPWLGLLITLVALLGLCMCLRGAWARCVAIVGTFALAAVTLAFSSPTILLFLPPVCVNLGLAWFFGRTLAPGREALITRFARLEHPQPDIQRMAYTRRLTGIWAAFFLLMAAVSTALAASGAHEAWVWFTAVGNYICVAALFALEYVFRRRTFRSDDRVSTRQQIRMLRDALRDQRW
jgi:uncharacterized membrane protein